MRLVEGRRATGTFGLGAAGAGSGVAAGAGGWRSRAKASPAETTLTPVASLASRDSWLAGLDGASGLAGALGLASILIG